MRQNSNQTKHLPTLLVQQIRLQWYKDCRGGNAAAQRNHPCSPGHHSSYGNHRSTVKSGRTGTFIHLPAEPDSFHAGRPDHCNHFLCSRIPCRDDITDQLIRSTNCNGTGKTTFIPRTCMRCHCSNRNHRFTSDSRHRLHMDGYSFYIHLSTGRGTRRNHVLLGM